ncbi:MAG: hypothetical protein DRI73_01560, partial [Bacteroidetes bacterium]
MNNSRRSFLKKTALGSLGFTILPSFGNVVAPSDRLR